MKNEKSISVVNLVQEIRQVILSARGFVVSNINTIQVLTNFKIGQQIVEYEQKGAIRAKYGKQLLVDLSRQLTAEFGRGFSRSNLEYMRKFYLIYQNRLPSISQMPSGKLALDGKSQIPSGKLIKPAFRLSWSQYVFLLGIKDAGARNFYEIEAADNNWPLPELTRQFNSGLYERLALSRDKKGIRKMAQKATLFLNRLIF